jgi:hypothetical protein
MKPYRIVVIFLIVAFIVGCAGSSKKMNALKLGMTKLEVIEAIGSPNSTSAAGDIEYLRYRLDSGGFSADEYYVKLLDGKVGAYGKRGDLNIVY